VYNEIAVFVLFPSRGSVTSQKTDLQQRLSEHLRPPKTMVKIKVKVKFTLEQAKKAQTGSKSIVPLFL
jgi:hypothetical protein